MSRTNHGTGAVCHDAHLARRRDLACVVMRWVLLVGALVGVLVGCGSDDDELSGTAREARVVARLVEEVATEAPVDPAVPEALPLVFVAGFERTFPIDVQAAVAADLVDDVAVRFVDERLEAIDDTLDHRPVREGGVLLVVGPVPEERRAIEVEVERYLDAAEVERRMVLLVWRDRSWTITSTEVVPIPVPPG